jgi:hypothetical protein
MGYLVQSSGRLLLPERLEPQVLTVLEVELLRHDGWFQEDDVEAVDSLRDLARYAAVDLTRDGEWLTVTTDEDGDPKWSDQAAAFYTGLARWVLQGEVRVAGEDGQRWSYRYTPDGLVQEGVTDDTGAGNPRDETSAAAPLPEPATPPTQLTQPPQPPLPAPPTGATGPGTDPATDPAAAARDFWADDPAPRPRRTLAMTLLLVVGVILIIGVASLAAGMVG